MLTSKYHIASIVAVFFALGIGILLGGTLGQRWMFHTEDNIVQTLMDKYEGQVSQNQLLQKQIGSLQLMNQSLSPILGHKRIWWIHSGTENNEMLDAIMKSAGAQWVNKSADVFVEAGPNRMPDGLQPYPDLIVVSDPEISRQLSWQQLWKDGESLNPKIIDISEHGFQLDEPKSIVDFILYLRKVIEEESDAAVSVYHYPGLE